MVFLAVPTQLNSLTTDGVQQLDHLGERLNGLLGGCLRVSLQLMSRITSG